MHKVANGEYLEKVTSMFNLKNNVNHDLRNNNCDYILEKPRTNFLKKSISYLGAKVWNDLPNHLKDEKIPLGRFKTLHRDRL